MSFDLWGFVDRLLPWIGGAVSVALLEKAWSLYRAWRTNKEQDRWRAAVLRELRGLRRDLRLNSVQRR